MGQLAGNSIGSAGSEGSCKSRKKDDLSENGGQAQGGRGFPQQFSNIFNQIINRNEKGGLAKKADELKQKKQNQPLGAGEEDKEVEQQDAAPLLPNQAGVFNQQQQFYMPQFDQANQQQMAMGQFMNPQIGQFAMDPNQLQQLQQAAFMNQQMIMANPAAIQQQMN